MAKKEIGGFDVSDRFGQSGLHVAAQRAHSGKPYLGDSQVAGAFARGFISQICDRVAAVSEGAMPQGEAMRADQAACHDAAAVFLGKNPAFESMGQWNSEGGIADWMLEQLKHVYDRPEAQVDRDKIVEDVFGWTVAFTYEAISAHQEDDSEEGLQDDLTHLADDLARFLVGVPGQFEHRVFV
jgi:hypothetical protein